jgi:hypothetical protein
MQSRVPSVSAREETSRTGRLSSEKNDWTFSRLRALQYSAKTPLCPACRGVGGQKRKAPSPSTTLFTPHTVLHKL